MTVSAGGGMEPIWARNGGCSTAVSTDDGCFSVAVDAAPTR